MEGENLIQWQAAYKDAANRLQAIACIVPELLSLSLEPMRDEDQIRSVADDILILTNLDDETPEEGDWYGLWSGNTRTDKTRPPTFETNIYTEDGYLAVGFRFFGTREQLMTLVADRGEWDWNEEGYYYTYYTVNQMSVKKTGTYFSWAGVVVEPTSSGWVVINKNTGEVEQHEID